MDQKLFIANWKSHKIPSQVEAFFDTLHASAGEINWDNKKVIIAPPYPLLGKSVEAVKKTGLSISISSQDVSSFEEGAHTGEVAARLIKEYAEFAIIGHSERRESLHENDELLQKKVEQALSSGITPIYCVQNVTQQVPQGVTIIAYEPITAIGTGNPDDPTHIEEVFNTLHGTYPQTTVLYGGSVTAENSEQFLVIPSLGGFIIGGASLEAGSFISLLRQW